MTSSMASLVESVAQAFEEIQSPVCLFTQALEEIPFNFTRCLLSFTVPPRPVTSCHEQNCSDMELILARF